MFGPLLDRVRRETSGERALESVRALARFHRVQASPGYDQASQWVASQLASYGLEVETETVPGDGRTRLLGNLMPEGWECSRAFAILHEGRASERLCDYDVEKLSLVLRSQEVRGRFPLVTIEDGTAEEHYHGVDVRGAVVLTRGALHRVHQLAVLERGAAGLLCDGRRLVPPVRDRFTDPDALNYTSFWWQGDEPRGWGFVVSPRAGERLRERLRAGAKLELEVEIESRAFPTPIPLLSARLPGDRPGEVLVMAHLCHPQPSANDNASGAAAALETARVLAALRSHGEFAPGRGVRFLWVPELTGSCAWLGVDAERTSGLVAALNLDMVGESQELCGSTFLIEHPPCWDASFAEVLLAQIRDEAVDGVASYRYSMTRMAEIPYSGGSDHIVFQDPAVAVPCPMMIQWPDRYYHTSHDTPDKTDPASLALAVRCAASYAGFLALAGERENEWLAHAIGRDARRRWLRALDHERPAWSSAREAERGRAALASLGRLGADSEAVAESIRAFEEFGRREGLVAASDPLPADSNSTLRPRRLIQGPLPFLQRLLPRFSSLARSERERWHELDARDPGSLCELAWRLADGHRSLDTIARLVWLETGKHEPRLLADWFNAATTLGLCESSTAKDEACSPDAPTTATR